MSQTIEEDLTVLFEDLDFNLKCEAINYECFNAAAWRYVSKCDMVCLLCEKCHKSIQKDMYLQVGCSICFTFWEMGQFTSHWSWSKI